jgi:hypothetical protein
MADTNEELMKAYRPFIWDNTYLKAYPMAHINNKNNSERGRPNS